MESCSLFVLVKESSLHPLSRRIVAWLNTTTVLIAVVMFTSASHADTIALVGTMATSADFSDVITLDVPYGLQMLTVRLPIPQTQAVFGQTQTTKTVNVIATPTATTVSTSSDSFGNKYQVETYATPAAGIYTFKIEATRVNESSDLSAPLPVVQISNINPPTDVQQYTKSTSEIESDDPQILSLAKSLETNSQDEATVTQNIQKWLQKNIQDHATYYNNAQDATTVLARKNGQCNGWTQLFIALARAEGIPARYVGGYSFGGQIQYPKDSEGIHILTVSSTEDSHAWAEVWYPNLGWVPYEPQMTSGFVDTHRLKVWTGVDCDSPLDLVSWTTKSPKQISINTSETQKPVTMSDIISVNCDKVVTDDPSITSLARLVGSTNH